MVPALAVAEELRAEGVEVAFIGAGRAEAELIPAAGFALHSIAVEGLSRSNPLRAARALALAVAAVPRARTLLKELAPDAVMGAGGYVAGPVGVAALTLGTPLVLTEADSHIGLTNRVLARWAARVCLAFPPGEQGISRLGRGSARYLVTGRPVPMSTTDRAGARVRLGISPEEFCVLVFGGSLGARSLNLAAVEAFAGADFHVLHVCGRRDYPWMSQRELGGGYDLREFMSPADFGEALAAADLVVARAGGSVFEIAAHALPAILVPYPHASGDHQSANARWMTAAGAATTIPDRELNGPHLARLVAALIADPSRMAQMRDASAGLARPAAAAEVAHELLLAGAP